MGCGSKVTATGVAPRSAASRTTRVSTSRCPRCTPSKLPSVTTVGPRSAGMSSSPCQRSTATTVVAAPAASRTAVRRRRRLRRRPPWRGPRSAVSSSTATRRPYGSMAATASARCAPLGMRWPWPSAAASSARHLVDGQLGPRRLGQRQERMPSARRARTPPASSSSECACGEVEAADPGAPQGRQVAADAERGRRGRGRGRARRCPTTRRPRRRRRRRRPAADLGLTGPGARRARRSG